MGKPHKQTLREVLAANVRNERIQRELTQEKLASMAGLSMRQVSQIESAKPATSVDTIDMLAKAFQIEASELLRRK